MKVQRVSALLLATGLVACMTTTSIQALTLNEDTARLGLAGISLGDAQDVALAEASKQLLVSPSCSARKVALKDSRKALLHETCEFVPAGTHIAGAAVDRIACHFIDGRLLRIDIEARGEPSTIETLQAELSSRYGDADASSLQWVWQSAGDEAMLSTSADATNSLSLRLLDAKIAERAESLTEP